MHPGYRCVSIGLCAALLLSALGCATGREEAESESQYLYPGMSMQEVSDQLGQPVQVIRGEPGSETVWIYRYEGGPSTAATILLVVFFVAIIALAVMARGGGAVSGGGFGGEGPPCVIRLRFDGDGRLIDVSPPLPVPGP
ncbi:MAG TPA: hypothetical protein VKU80_07465 [Planctomycetota bacterium]|nr:hypothetical protein [Planctomycetota bacterium]